MFSADSFKPTIAVSGTLRRLRQGHGSKGAAGESSGSTGTRPSGLEIHDGQDIAEEAVQAENDSAVSAGTLPAEGVPVPHAAVVERRTGATESGRQYRLRRDGARPLRFVGLPLLRVQRRWHINSLAFEETSAGAVSLRQRLEFYLEDASPNVIASAILEPAETARFRPVFSVRRLNRPEDLQALLRSHFCHCAASLPHEIGTTLATEFAAMMSSGGVRGCEWMEDVFR